MTNAKTYFATTTPKTVTASTTLTKTTTVRVPKTSSCKVGDKKPKGTFTPTSNKPKPIKKMTDTCQSLDVIPEEKTRK